MRDYQAAEILGKLGGMDVLLSGIAKGVLDCSEQMREEFQQQREKRDQERKDDKQQRDTFAAVTALLHQETRLLAIHSFLMLAILLQLGVLLRQTGRENTG